MPTDGDEWLRYANDDLAGAFLLLADSQLPARLACFHAQQVAEKALKALLAEAHPRCIFRDASRSRRSARLPPIWAQFLAPHSRRIGANRLQISERLR